MKAKELKEFINQIPDNKEIIFEYSCFTFGDVCGIDTDKRRMAYSIDMSFNDFKENYPGRNYCMLHFTN